ncbi:VOC family protein [Oceanibacterium hippocampi]|uniref:Glyoxalase-like domain protein n=1 Tax=Oceanibacterium hippocampi TaxID=745714 RepID=A0A1Y5SCD1_9PROT|nr:VOC family protein [Oceanibacterium hippocampi]SLN36391.1 Glyoxalase-like domain protein [Oceanibacterium hippocampi]
MPLLAFDHVNIRTANLAEMVAWYEEVLGLTRGPRPPIKAPGAWLYLGDAAILHLIEGDPAPSAYSEGESLRMEHMAFRAQGLAAFIARLEEHGIAYRRAPFEAMGTVVVNLRDPDGNHIHVDFPATES